MDEKTQISKRFKEFGQQKFGSERGWMARFAEALAMDPGALRNYLIGDRIPGSRMQSKLREFGCDIEWLMTGKRGEEAIIMMKEPGATYIIPAEIPKKTREKIKQLIEQLSELDDAEIERAETIIRTIFPNARKKRSPVKTEKGGV